MVTATSTITALNGIKNKIENAIEGSRQGRISEVDRSSRHPARKIGSIVSPTSIEKGSKGQMFLEQMSNSNILIHIGF